MFVRSSVHHAMLNAMEAAHQRECDTHLANRATLTQQRDDARRELAVAVEARNDWQHRCIEAEARYHALAQKLVATIPAAKPSKVPPKPGNRIQEVIADVGGTNGPLRKQLGAYARQQARDGVDEDAIVHALMHWQAEDDDE